MHVEPRCKVFVILNFIKGVFSANMKVARQRFLSTLVGFKEVGDSNLVDTVYLVSGG